MGIIEYKRNKKLLIIILVASLSLNSCAIAKPELKPTTTKKIEEISLAELVKYTTKIDLVIFLNDSSKFQGQYNGFTSANTDSDSSNMMITGDLYVQTSDENRKISSNEIVKILHVTEHHNIENIIHNAGYIYLGVMAMTILMLLIFNGCAVQCA
ncbi:hypothetical protein E3V33_04760 [Candidatus Marinimicrobia bacterium MT.SAG.4]|nr:hypothetical protein E3V33_04760 [Candidatus Marinimicrobia bacterium MT.SAG.4]